MRLSLLSWLLQTLPESLAAASLAVVFCTRKMLWRKISFIGLPFAAAVYLVRLLPLAFGVHFIILIIILASLLSMQLKTNFSRCLLTALVTGIILAVFETIFVFIGINITGIPIEQTIQDLYTNIRFAWPHITALFLLALAISSWAKNTPMKGRKDNE